MAYEQRDNTGTLFNNDRKQKENQPDFKGEALINGVTYEVAGWNKVSKKGSSYLSLSYKVKSATYPINQPMNTSRQSMEAEQELPF